MNTNKKKYRILYIITQGILGGAQTHIRHLCENLKEDCDVHVAVGVYGPLVDDLSKEGIAVHVVPSLVRPISPFKDIGGFRELKRLIKSVKPDLISTHSSKAGILGRLAAKVYGVPVIFTAHGWAFTEGVPSAKRIMYIWAERFAAKWADKIICVSENDRKLALDYGVATEEQLITIHNGMPIINGTFNDKKGKEDKAVEFIMVARFSEQKDHQLLLTAIRHTNSQNNYVLSLVGDGELLESTRTLCLDMTIEDKIRFLGPRQDVPELLTGADAFVLTSNWEGLPRRIIEAMRAGLPVVASDVGGINELVEEGVTGFLVPRGDAETLRARLEILIDNPEIRHQMGMAGYERFLEKFTFDRMLTETVKVYEEVMQKHGKKQG